MQLQEKYYHENTADRIACNASTRLFLRIER